MPETIKQYLESNFKPGEIKAAEKLVDAIMSECKRKLVKHFWYGNCFHEGSFFDYIRDREPNGTGKLILYKKYLSTKREYLERRPGEVGKADFYATDLIYDILTKRFGLEIVQKHSEDIGQIYGGGFHITDLNKFFDDILREFFGNE